VAGVRDLAVQAGSGEVRGGRAAVGCREVPVREAVEGDGRNRDGRLCRELHLELVEPGVTGGEPEAVAVRVEDDLDVVGIVEGRGGAT
jgi:hypothetical protein